MPCGKKRKRHKMSTHKRKKRLRKDRHKKRIRQFYFFSLSKKGVELYLRLPLCKHDYNKPTQLSWQSNSFVMSRSPVRFRQLAQKSAKIYSFRTFLFLLIHKLIRVLTILITIWSPNYFNNSPIIFIVQCKVLLGTGLKLNY